MDEPIGYFQKIIKNEKLEFQWTHQNWEVFRILINNVYTDVDSLQI